MLRPVPVLRPWSAPMNPVLYYHRVGPFRSGAPRKMTVLPENFHRQMRHLARRRYVFSSLDDVDAGGKRAAITFDDGYLDVLEYGVPVLSELNIPAAFFVVAGAAGMTDSWYRSEERIMDWPHLRELVKYGFTIGSHSMTHATLDQIPIDSARREIVDSKKLIEDRLGVSVLHFAYPKGHYSPIVMDLVRDAGYRMAWATKSGDGSSFARRRFPISASRGLLGFSVKMLKIRLDYY